MISVKMKVIHDSRDILNNNNNNNKNGDTTEIVDGIDNNFLFNQNIKNCDLNKDNINDIIDNNIAEDYDLTY